MNILFQRLNKRTWSTLSLLIYIYIVLQLSACKKLIDVSPPSTAVTGASVYTSDDNAISVLTSLYSTLISSGIQGGLGSVTLFPALSCDELSVVGSSTTYSPYYTNNLNNLTGSSVWNGAYPMLFTINSAIIGIESSSTLTPSIKRQLLGEAKFLRSFCYFYLTNTYGDVPLVTTIDYNVNSSVARTAQAMIYQQIISDLQVAKSTLSNNYLDGTLLATTNERVRPTKWAAEALLSRVYLYTGDWKNAEKEADSIINYKSFYKLDSLGRVFIKNGLEAIWQLQPVILSAQNTPDGALFILPASGPSSSSPVYLSNFLVNSFENGDLRKQNWTGNVKVGINTYYYPYKYKYKSTTSPETKEYQMVFRLGEQYLIRSEARAQQDKLIDAANDLDTIRNRAGLPIINITTKASLLSSILHERQVELFTEWGHRWFDLKRTTQIDAVMNTVAIQKGGNWASYKQLYPIPATEIVKDINLTQNSGY